MHEMSIALNIIELASEAAQAAAAHRISSIELEIGTLAGVMIESLELCFEAAARAGITEGSLGDVLQIITFSLKHEKNQPRQTHHIPENRQRTLLRQQSKSRF